MSEARRAGEVDRGWLPDILPDGATNVRERHNIDTNETWCSFDLTGAESSRLRAAMSPLAPHHVSAWVVRPPGVGWWPRVLEGALDSRAVDKSGMEAGSLVFALEAGGRRGYMYRAHAP